LNNLLSFSAIPQHFLFNRESVLVPEIQIGRIGGEEVYSNVVKAIREQISHR
jgi:hypothetical protein